MSTRLDQLLVLRELADSREKAKRYILAGWVKVAGETVTQPSRKTDDDADIALARPGGEFVSRGGKKIERALEYFAIDVTGTVCVDLGASTGGFTDCLLKGGAAKVYAVDVGHNQLAWSLRQDDRVVVMEKQNVRALDAAQFAEKITFVAGDLSFISLDKVYPVIQQLFHPVRGVLLIKPQFEARPSEHRKGVVRDPATHIEILNRTLEYLAGLGMRQRGLTWSPITGPKGNIEFLIYFSTSEEGSKLEAHQVASVVEEAHHELK